MVKASFFQLRLLAKGKLYLSQKDLHCFADDVQMLFAIKRSLPLTIATVYLYVGIDQAELNRLQLVQNAAARLLTGTKKR